LEQALHALRRRKRPDPSQRHGVAIPFDPLYRQAERWGDQAFRRQCRLSLRHALAETIIGLYKTEVIKRRDPWRGFKDVEFATLEWVDWFNRRLL